MKSHKSRNIPLGVPLGSGLLKGDGLLTFFGYSSRSSGGTKPWRRVFSEIVLGVRNCKR